MNIAGYDPTGFTAGSVYMPSSILVTTSSCFLWKPRTVADVSFESLKLFLVIHPRPEIVFVGTGKDPPQERYLDIEQAFREEGIAVEFMDTRNAIHSFNILNNESRMVGAALLTPEPREEQATRQNVNDL